jgi:hypothetical protein
VLVPEPRLIVPFFGLCCICRQTAGPVATRIRFATLYSRAVRVATLYNRSVARAGRQPPAPGRAQVNATLFDSAVALAVGASVAWAELKERIGASEIRATRNRRRATDDVQQTTCNRRRATDDVQQTTCNRQRATDNAQQTTRNRQRATDNAAWTRQIRQHAHAAQQARGIHARGVQRVAHLRQRMAARAVASGLSPLSHSLSRRMPHAVWFAVHSTHSAF